MAAPVAHGLLWQRVNAMHPRSGATEYKTGYSHAIAKVLAVIEKDEGPRKSHATLAYELADLRRRQRSGENVTAEIDEIVKEFCRG